MYDVPRSRRTAPGSVVIADDDPDDRDLIVDAWRDVRPGIAMECVSNGRHLLNLLETSAANHAALPTLVLLDLNMPLVDGWAALRTLKQHPTLRSIPIVIFTTSAVREHVYTAYEMQAAGFITKPSSYRELVKIITTLDQYWIATVRTPDRDREV